MAHGHLELALLVAAQAGDANTVSKIVALMHANMLDDAGNVVRLDDHKRKR